MGIGVESVQGHSVRSHCKGLDPSAMVGWHDGANSPVSLPLADGS
jgi:hypothetical protein